MLRRIDLSGEVPGYSARALRELMPRAAFDVNEALRSVQPLIDDIRHRGTSAVVEIVERFDHVRLEHLRVPDSAIKTAVEELDPELRRAYQTSIDRVRTAHEAQRLPEVVTEVAPGGTVTERYLPVGRVGLYAPGGLAVLASSVIMNAVPAQIAGVGSIALASPAQKNNGGLPDPGILAVAGMLGLDEVYSVGGPAAIGMFAYGTDECAPVDMITGPGNIYVTAAKRAVRGLVGIDAEAGTTEIAVIADATADPVHVAVDLISQAEHDPAAASVLITDSADLADAVDDELARRVPDTRHAGRIQTALAGEQSGTILVADIDEAVAVADAYAAEHLEVQTADAREVALRIRNAGAIFVGAYSPVSLGDYCAGSNHVLPTGGCARHSAGLSVHTFLRAVHLIDYTREALEVVADDVVAFANSEDLPSHGEAVSARFEAR
ncbi:histidinol dehydrogenase [Glycomyces algeriensis]|uniref:Histidinol dehydrogenase n=1 Tax=Glycomyces algeriensis TaxID=256037 RepID=A0A9W6LG11_9ACTN|nr:histidinol dehydrogenase [Glycomyces algeriensis]MDA1365153.1 histidinol dehydrogenase [Glycomyces algeriensis]MDR7349783.1 histidinol dehydrogenase [Glycomyces algeriensis]GLI42492.1 histidinol dehydrogenase [Glycomyces algeriensis]